MTTLEAHKRFKMEVDKWDSMSSIPSFTAEEIDYWLNSSLLRLIKTKISGLNVHRAGLEQTQKRLDDLRMLIVSTNYSGDDLDVTMIGSNDVYLIDYPSDYLHGVSDSVVIHHGSKSIISDTIEATNENLDFRLKNSFSEHRIHNGYARPIKFHRDDQINILCENSYSLHSYTLIYVKTPPKIDHNIQSQVLDFMPENVWDEVIVNAARIALINISDARYSAYAQESQIVE